MLDTPRESMFDSLIFTVAQLFRVPVAALMLVGDDRTWTKASVGPLEQNWDRAVIFAETVVQSGEPLMLEDADADPRFANMFRGPEDARGSGPFCMALPVTGPGGYRIGALVALDPRPRAVPRRQLLHFQQLSEQAGDLLRLRVPGLDLTAYGGYGAAMEVDRAIRSA